jgi:ABC-2 type transport system permease protein
MNPKRVLTIFYKDARSAILDGRVLVAILLPIAVAVFYNFVFDDESQTPSVTVAHTATTSALPEALDTVAGGTASLTFETADPQQVRRMVATGDADLGLVAPDGFDAALRNGGDPRLTVLLPDPGSLESEVAASSVDPALRALAGQGVPADVQTETVERGGTGNVLAQIGASGYWVLFGVGFLVVMVCMYALPTILTEESEKKTLDALVMVASYGEVIAAKALVGLLYISLSVVLTLVLTRVAPEDPLLFGVAVLLLSVVLVGVGLLMGGLFRNANQLSTWSSFLSLPVLGSVLAVLSPLPDAVEKALDFIPTSQAMRLAINGMSGEAVFPNATLSFAVIAAWGAVTYLIVLWTLQRWQA